MLGEVVFTKSDIILICLGIALVFVISFVYTYFFNNDDD